MTDSAKIHPGTISSSSGFSLAEALDARSVAACRALIAEYGLMLPEPLRPSGDELRNLPGPYGRPSGRLLLARIVGEPAGCVALRALARGEAEMKRLFVREDHRGMGIGRMLAEAVIDEARGMGYRRLLLDTLPTMEAARRMYATLGFAATPAYNDNPVPGVRFMALAL